MIPTSFTKICNSTLFLNGGYQLDLLFKYVESDYIFLNKILQIIARKIQTFHCHSILQFKKKYIFLNGKRKLMYIVCQYK